MQLKAGGNLYSLQLYVRGHEPNVSYTFSMRGDKEMVKVLKRRRVFRRLRRLGQHLYIVQYF